MRFNIFPPEGLKSVEPRFHVEPRQIARTIERELSRKPLAGLYSIDGVGAALPVSMLEIRQALIVMKPEVKPEGGFSGLIGGQRIVGL